MRRVARWRRRQRSRVWSRVVYLPGTRILPSGLAQSNEKAVLFPCEQTEWFA